MTETAAAPWTYQTTVLLDETRPVYVGVDPGANGAVAFVDADGACIEVVRVKHHGDDDLGLLRAVSRIASYYHPVSAALERVHSMPKQGTASSFKFGVQYGRMRMLLAAVGARFQLVPPSTWQRDMHCLTGGNKNVTKELAARLFPELKVTHDVADALLLAEWARTCGRWRVGGE